MRLRPLALAAIWAGGMVVPAAHASPALRIHELPGREALPRTPPLAPPQPPVTEVQPIRGTVFARELVTVGMAADGSPRAVRVVQRLLVRSLGDYAFFVPAPAVTVAAGAASESKPGLRPNQIIWQGFSPRRKTLVADAELRPQDSVGALPLRVRVSGAPIGPGPFELTIRLENATRARAVGLAGDAVQADVTAALRALRAAARVNRRIEGRAVRLRGPSRPATLDVWAPLSVRGVVAFPRGAVDGLVGPRFSRVLDGETASITVRGTAVRAAAPKLTIRVELLVRAALPPPSARSLDAAVRGYLRYARVGQFQSFLANPDPRGRSTTTYVYETAAERPAATASRPSGDTGFPAAVVIGGLVLLAACAVVLWAHL